MEPQPGFGAGTASLEDGEPRARARLAGTTARFPYGGGEMGAAIRARDWSHTPVGPAESWPPALRNALSLMLNSQESMFVMWGVRKTFLFNDAYRPTLGPRLPTALGADISEVWADTWDQVLPVVERALAGEGTRFEQVPLTMSRYGELEHTWWTFSFSPLYDDDGRIAGMLGVTREVTDQVLSAQRVRADNAALTAMFERTPSFIALLRGPEHRFELLNSSYSELIGHRDVLGRTVRESLPDATAQGYVDLLDGVFASGEAFSASGSRYAVQPVPGGPVRERFVDFVFQPLPADDGATEAIFVEGHDVTDRMLGLQALRSSEERYRTLFEGVEVGFCIIELRFVDGEAVDYLIVEANPAFARQTGADLTGRWVSEFAPDLERHWFETYGRVATTGEPAHFENYAAVFNRWFDVRALRSGDPARNRVAILFSDITQRRQTEVHQAALLRLSDRMRDLSEPDDVAHAACDVLCETLSAELVSYEVLDVGRGSVTVMRGGRASMPPRAGRELLGSLPIELYEGRNVVVSDALSDIRFPDPAPGEPGSFAYVPVVEHARLVALLHVAHAGPRAWSETELVLAREVAERIRAASERSRSEGALRALAERRLWADVFESSDAMIAALGTDWRILSANRAYVEGFTAIFGVAPAVGDHLPTLFRDIPLQRELTMSLWGRALAGEEFTVLERFGPAGGDNPYFEIRYNTLRERDGRQIGAFLYAVDVTDRIRGQARLADAEEALRQAQKMEAVGQLTGGLAHDFNNLLAGISGNLEMLERRIDQGRLSDVPRYVAAAQGASRRAAALTHRLLAFSRRQTLAPTPTDVNGLVAAMADLVRRTVGPSVDLVTVPGDGLWTTLVDASQLDNALLNLCINARDAMPDGGRIVIATDNRELDAATARDHGLEPGPYVRLSVSDTGSGMPPEVIARAFEPFYTTKPLGSGTGLGLSMIYGFAKQSGGQVRISSAVGEGTRVCLYLPRHAGDPLPDEAHAAAGGPDPGEGSGTVLVVDDESSVRTLVVEILRDMGFETLEADDGASGLRILQSPARIDLLVTDVGLPNGMNGRQMADAGRIARPDLGVLFITGYAEKAAISDGHLGHGMEVMTKPFKMDALAARIREMALRGTG